MVMSEDEEAMKTWGFEEIVTWTDEPNAYYPAHSHDCVTLQYIRRGHVKVLFPDDPACKQATQYEAGAKVYVPKGVRHEVWVGGEGATTVLGRQK